jgi:hypothetical protein
MHLCFAHRLTGGDRTLGTERGHGYVKLKEQSSYMQTTVTELTFTFSASCTDSTASILKGSV